MKGQPKFTLRPTIISASVSSINIKPMEGQPGVQQVSFGTPEGFTISLYLLEHHTEHLKRELGRDF